MNKCDNPKCKKKATFQYGENLKGKIASWCSKDCSDKFDKMQEEKRLKELVLFEIRHDEKPIILSKRGAETFPELIGKKVFMRTVKKTNPITVNCIRVRIAGLKTLRTMSKNFWIIPNTN